MRSTGEDMQESQDQTNRLQDMLNTGRGLATRLRIPLTALPGPTPDGAPGFVKGLGWVTLHEVSGDEIYVSWRIPDSHQRTVARAPLPEAFLDLSPPPTEEGKYQTRIDGLDVGLKMLSTTVGEPTTFCAFNWDMPARARSEARRYRLFTIGQLKGWADRDTKDGWPVVPGLGTVDPHEPDAVRLALREILFAKPWAG